MRLYGSTRYLDIDESQRLGQGGIGQVFLLGDEAVKVYQRGKKETEEKDDKLLRWPTKHRRAAFPEELLYTSNQEYAGYSMPAFRGTVSFETICNPVARADAGIVLTENAKYVAVKRFFKLVDEIHGLNLIIGDLHPGNFLLDPQKLTVFSVDVDSFEFEITEHGKRKRFASGVGIDRYLAPECESAASGRTKSTDVFAAGILAWLILKDGDHPAEYAAPDKPSIKDRIKSRTFPLLTGTCPAGGSPIDLGIPFKDFPTELQRCFYKTFLSDSRPSLKDFIRALDKPRHPRVGPVAKRPVPKRAAPKLPVPQLPVPQLPVPQLPVPQLPVPQLPVPQLPVPQLALPQARAKTTTGIQRWRNLEGWRWFDVAALIVGIAIVAAAYFIALAHDPQLFQH